MRDKLEFRLSGTEGESVEGQAAITSRTAKTARDIAGLNHATALNTAVDRATRALLSLQHEHGHWSFELEADCTIPAEYILMMHFTGEVDESLQTKLAVYLRGHQGNDGGWPLYHSGEAEISCSVKSYYALKLAGDSPDAPHMSHARQFIFEQGGAARCNVFTRIELAVPVYGTQHPLP